MNVDLARKANIRGEFCLDGEAVFFYLSHFTGIARQHFYAAGCTARVSAATMENIYTGIFDGQHQLSPLRRNECLRTCSCISINSRHLTELPDLFMCMEI
jgi:hypothetical protein